VAGIAVAMATSDDDTPGLPPEAGVGGPAPATGRDIPRSGALVVSGRVVTWQIDPPPDVGEGGWSLKLPAYVCRGIYNDTCTGGQIAYEAITVEAQCPVELGRFAENLLRALNEPPPSERSKTITVGDGELVLRTFALVHRVSKPDGSADLRWYPVTYVDPREGGRLPVLVGPANSDVAETHAEAVGRWTVGGAQRPPIARPRLNC